ncbi:integrating conjugative element protein [Aquisalimonas lutea]|uniref:integrating conjugative element protein n=1 Tax=Aquisalimonas lutea TaxID=1327750 RepID=UPI0025B48AB4|nr:integrating conjugative element protein [Aquisalimonas lutea]MDN3519020.1 integrating conjugative element protein [Aquisalimonas lutea]
MRSSMGVVIATTALLAWAGLAGADEEGEIARAFMPAETGTLYYEIGGASPVSPPPNPEVTTMTLGLEASAGLGYSCGQFDPEVAIENQLNQIASGADAMVDKMVNAAKSAVASLPAYVLQRANPGLYDLFQNSLIRAEEQLEVATKNCQQIEREIADGQNPYADLVTLSKGDEWNASVGAGADIIETNESIEENAGDHGVEWLGGETAGGLGDEPIEAIGDVVRAGYNVTLNRAPNAGSDVPSGPDAPPIAQAWDSPGDAEQWATRVLGDENIMTCQSGPECETETEPGVGLLPVLQERNAEISDKLAELISGARRPTTANLREVSAPSVAVSRTLIESLRELPEQDQAVAAGRLAQEVATAQTMERALMVRRMLLTGRRVPEINRSSIGDEHASEAIDEIEREIESLMLEAEAREAVVSNTAEHVIDEARRLRNDAIDAPTTPAEPGVPIREGVPMDTEN